MQIGPVRGQLEEPALPLQHPGMGIIDRRGRCRAVEVNRAPIEHAFNIKEATDNFFGQSNLGLLAAVSAALNVG